MVEPRLSAGQFALIGAGGAAGVLARHGLSMVSADPALVTAGINIVGSFLLGVLIGSFRGRSGAGWAVPLLGAGFLGALTTFSGVVGLFALSPDPLLALLLIGQVILGVVAAWGGLEVAALARSRPA